MKKYAFTDKRGFRRYSAVRQIVALRDVETPCGLVKAGELGGWLESEKNLSHEGNCWVFPMAVVAENAEVSGNAIVGKGGTKDCLPYGRDDSYETFLGGNAKVTDNSVVRNECCVTGETEILGDSVLWGVDLKIEGKARLEGAYCVGENIHLNGDVRLTKVSLPSGFCCEDAVEIRSTNEYLAELTYKDND